MKTTLILILLMAFPVAGLAEEREGNTCEGLLDTFPCNLKIISRVEVSLQGDLLIEHKGAFENLIRLRLRNDLPAYQHESENF